MSAPRLAVRGATVRVRDRGRRWSTSTSRSAPAEVVAVLGPSGSGKSTLLRAVAGLQPLDAGSIEIDGRDLARRPRPPARRRPDVPGPRAVPAPRRRAATSASACGCRGWSRSAVAARVVELLEVVGPARGRGRDRWPSCRAASSSASPWPVRWRRRPAVLLLDEPLGALDRALRDRLVDELRAIFTRAGAHGGGGHARPGRGVRAGRSDRAARPGPGRCRPARQGRCGPRRSRAVLAELLGFTNLVDGAAARGRVSTPWGELPAPPSASGAVTVVVRPDARRPRPPGRRAGGRPRAHLPRLPHHRRPRHRGSTAAAGRRAVGDRARARGAGGGADRPRRGRRARAG